MPYQEKSRKTLTHLKTLAEVVGQLEDNTNMVLREVLNGSENGMNPDAYILKGVDAPGPAQNVPKGVSEASPSIDKPAR
jgi:hypothetical protein